MPLAIGCGPVATLVVPFVESMLVVEDEPPICIAVNGCAWLVLPPVAPAVAAPIGNRSKNGSPATHEMHVQPAGVASAASSSAIMPPGAHGSMQSPSAHSGSSVPPPQAAARARRTRNLTAGVLYRGLAVVR